MKTPWQAIRDKLTRTVIMSAPYQVSRVLDLSAEDLYETQPHLRTVIDFLMDNMAQIPLKCYTIEEDGGRRRDRTSPAALLLRKPNSGQTQFEFMRQLVGEMALYDICYTAIGPDPDMKSGYSWHVIPRSWILGEYGGDPFNVEYIYITSQGGTPVKLYAENLVVFHGWSPKDPRKGSSPVEALKNTLAEQISANEFRQQIWKNGGRFAEYISRPKDVEPWDDDDIDRFRRNFKNAWSKRGSEAGGVPVLEDGMTVQAVQFNAKEAQWLETAELSIKTCCEVYGIKPAMITGEGQTYASVKENARSLYSDILGTKVAEIQQRVTEFVLPMIGAPDNEYVEYDMSAKLAGSFEEQAAILSTSTGAPWMLRSEARERMNLPRIDGTDEMIVPLNVLEGGLASPRDTDPADYNAAPVQRVMILGTQPEESKGKPRKARGHPEAIDGAEMEKALQKFFGRQKSSVLAKLGAKADGDWWDGDRWDAELADDLAPIMLAQATKSARRALRSIDIDPDEYDEARTEAYIRKVAEGRAHGINRVTKRALDAAIGGDLEEGATGSTPAGVFEIAQETRAEKSGLAIAACVAGWGLLESVRQCAAGEGVTKTWIHTPSANPRSEHEAMDGETVPYDGTFSNGAQWPGDTGALDADEIVNCQCEIEITIP